jgi:class 3 adenylate cyclase/tetratricopeptide (TPR) repeat protein
MCCYAQQQISLDDISEHREIESAMRCPNCQTLNPINAKYCLECGNRLLVCPHCGTISLPFAKFCIECGNPFPPPPTGAPVSPTSKNATVPLLATSPITIDTNANVPALPAVASNVATRATPTTSSAVSAGLLPPEERRVVTIMFADITGSTPLADRLDPEDMRAILTGYFNLMTEQIRKHGGTVEKYIGDAVMAVFGVPVAHEDDPDRAVRAALDMQAALSAFNEQRLAQDVTAARLQMRIGVNTGEVATPSSAQQPRQDFLITGDAVNVAARLQQAATPDTILIGERTYLATRGVFEVRAMAPLRVKGKADPLVSYVVLGLQEHSPIITQQPRGLNGQPAPLVGRQLELTLMHASYARVQAERHPHLITLLGAPGIGKTRLVREFIAREQEKTKCASSLGKPLIPRVLQGRCPPYGEGITYWPLVEILRSLLRVQPEDTFDTLRQRFTDLIAQILTSAKHTETPEEIATPILRSIGVELSGSEADARQTSQLYKERARREAQRSTHSSTGMSSTQTGAGMVSALGRLHSSVGTSSPPKQSGTQVELLRAWRVLLEALAQQHPLIIVVDDLQWADEALLDLLEYLTDRITSVPILFLCPARPDFFERRRDWGGGRRNFTTIELEALSPEETSELIDELLDENELPEGLRATIQARAEGNPFFVEEIIRMLVDQGILECVEDEEHHQCYWRLRKREDVLLSELATTSEPPDDTLINMHYLLPLRVPDTVQGVLAARVDLLNPLEKMVLQHAAIIGRTFWLSSLQELAQGTDAETLLEALHALMQRDLVVESEKLVHSPLAHDRVLSFKHILIRDVVYSNIPRARRVQEHARLALWLEITLGDERTRFVELLAYHYQQSLLNWSSGLALSAIEANNPGNPTEPLRLTRPELRKRAIAYLTLAGDQALHSYYTIRALQAYHDAAELLSDDDTDRLTRTTMHRKLGAAFMQRGNMEEAWQEYRKALHIATSQTTNTPDAPGVPQEELLCIYGRLAELGTRWLSGFEFNVLPNKDEVWGYIEAGLKLVPEHPVSIERVELLTYQAFWYIRQLEMATYPEKATLAEQALLSGHIALHLAEELNAPTTLSLALDALSFIYTVSHTYNEAHRLQHRRQKLEQFLTDREELYDLYTALGYVHELVADYPMALMWFGRAWSSAQSMESPALLLNSLVWRMRVWRQWNRWDEAQEVAQEILQLIERYQQDEKRQFWALETLATIAYRRGNTEQGDAYARQCKRLVDLQIANAGYDGQKLLATKMHAIHQASEDWTQALLDYKQKLQESEPMPSPEVLSTLAELMVVTGEDAEQQQATCDRAVYVAEKSGARKSQAIALRARGRMYAERQQWSTAENDLRQALRYCEVLDLPWERANTLYHLGRFYCRRAHSAADASKRSADLGRARYHFEQALGFFESLRAARGVERIRQALLQEIQPPV